MKTQTRIKIETANDGTQIFYPQCKEWFLWWNFREYVCWDYVIVRCFTTVEEAQAVIDEYLAADERTQAKKTKSITYVKYP